MNLAELITKWRKHLQELLEKQQELVTKAVDEKGESRTFTDEEQTEADAIKAEQETVRKYLDELEALQKAQADMARAINAPESPEAATRGAPAIITRDVEDSFAGQSFTRLVIARTLAEIDRVSPVAVAQQRWGRTNPRIARVLEAEYSGNLRRDIMQRATVAGHGSGSGEAGAELVSADSTFTGDFIEFLYARTIYFRLPLRVVPANVTIKGQDGAAGAGWVGEGKGIPATVIDTSTVSLTPLKVAAIAVGSLEWLRDSTPSGELLLRDSLVEAAAQKIDGTFFSTAAASAGVSPAGILNGVTAIASNGVDAADVREDLADLLTPFITNNNSGGQVVAMPEGIALRLALMTNSLSSASEFPDLTMQGGSIKGLSAFSGGNLADDWFVMLKPSDIWKIGADGIRVEFSRDASIEMADPSTLDATAGTGASLVGMFQTDSVAFKVVQPMNFQKRRTHAAQYIADAQYGESDTVTA